MKKEKQSKKYKEYQDLMESIYQVLKLSRPIYFVPSDWKPKKAKKELERLEENVLYEKEVALYENLSYYFFIKFFGKDEIKIKGRKIQPCLYNFDKKETIEKLATKTKG
ncbi:hypothetical protein KY314_00295 [Candidatus Woesearchaeota archaeon]|nr:hypothetical protein [Candidatus Woesearchaeota archaeon]